MTPYDSLEFSIISYPLLFPSNKRLCAFFTYCPIDYSVHYYENQHVDEQYVSQVDASAKNQNDIGDAKK